MVLEITRHSDFYVETMQEIKAAVGLQLYYTVAIYLYNNINTRDDSRGMWWNAVR